MGTVFVLAGSVKVVFWHRFRDTLSALEIVPRRLTDVVAAALPPVEIVLGLAVLCGWWPAGPLLLSLLCGFFLALALYRWRGGKELVCGCFADFERKTTTVSLIVRNLLLLAVGLPLLLP